MEIDAVAKVPWLWWFGQGTFIRLGNSQFVDIRVGEVGVTYSTVGSGNMALVY